jgi:hypothetical protein
VLEPFCLNRLGGLIRAYAQDIAEAPDIPPHKDVFVGIALGYADPQSSIKQFKTGRENLDAYLRWYE